MSRMSSRPPAPILVVLGLFGLSGLGCFIGVVVLTSSGRFDDALPYLAGLCFAAVIGMALWRRFKRARNVVILVGVASIVAALSFMSDASIGGLGFVVALPGALVIYLVTAPPSSQEWFRARDASQPSDDDQDISGTR
ncbi:MAG TPA: hypothetical protein H9881_18870 [Candidatus Stackebrandtia excrementipullorum]|nr:hypothetical protein [Candidatus Stackebrandtia excrementipullorum]